MGGPGSGGNRRKGNFKPTKYDKDIADKILERLATGETITSICRLDPTMPTLSTFWLWTRAKNDAPSSFKDEYEQQRRAQASTLAHEITDIADSLDESARRNVELELEALVEAGVTDERELRQARFKARKRSVEAAKEQIKARRWLAGRMHPNRWGDRVTMEHTSPEDKPVKLKLENLPDDLLEKIAELVNEVESRA